MNKVSVLLPYYNRRPLLQLTLDSFNHFYKDCPLEVVIVDDGSSEEHKVRDLVAGYSLDIKLIELQDKKGINPCYPYNVAARHATGDVFVLSSPETLHTFNMFKLTNNLCDLPDDSYWIFSVFCLTDKEMQSQLLGEWSFADKLHYLRENQNKFYEHLGELGYSFNNKYGSWYLHQEFRPSCLNFFTALTKDLYFSIGGFDERFRKGTGFDDRDFKMRVLEKVDNTVWHEAIAIHLDHEVVNDSPPQTNAAVFQETRTHPYQPNDEWGRL